MNIHVLGLGPTLKHFKGTNDFTIGVNDIFKHHKTNYLVCVDLPSRFSKERREIIEQSNPIMFYTQSNAWVYHKRFYKITLANKRGDISKFAWDHVPYSNNSTFVACSIAYLLGATNIIMWGVDFTNHHELNKGGNEERIFNDFRNLQLELTKRGTKLIVGHKDSALSEFIPVQREC